jgi:hypothetical protein
MGGYGGHGGNVYWSVRMKIIYLNNMWYLMIV